jgi:hypothetical protein
MPNARKCSCRRPRRHHTGPDSANAPEDGRHYIDYLIFITTPLDPVGPMTGLPSA